MEIVLDEWIFHYIQEESAKHAILFSFLERLVDKCDRFVIVRGASLDQKIHLMYGHCHQWGSTACALAQYFINFIRFDPDKVRTLEKQELADLPHDLEVLIPPDDVDLVRAAITVGAPILTTDQRLRDAVSGRSGLEFLMADHFLSSYDC